jgi:hypothetical protein
MKNAFVAFAATAAFLISGCGGDVAAVPDSDAADAANSTTRTRRRA